MGAAFYFVVTRTRIIPQVKMRKRYWPEKRKARRAFSSNHPHVSAILLFSGFLIGCMLVQDTGRLCGFDFMADYYVVTKHPFALVMGAGCYLLLEHVFVDEESGTPPADSSKMA